MYKIESIKFFDTSNIITITIINNNRKSTISFHKEMDGSFINNYRLSIEKSSQFLIENGFAIAIYPHSKYSKYGLQLTMKTLLSVL